jgi:triosephosphate isomerase
MKYTYIANWKMNISYNKSLDYCIDNQEQLKRLSTVAHIILCPSFVALAPVIEILKNSNVSIGAQNCSEYALGSYTGEISAQSLAQMGIKYCFVGHSERRIHFGETTDIIIKKINLLLSNNIQPIICIGETKEHFEQNATLTVLTEQLKPILENIEWANKPMLIAYEPIWSIGTGIIPENTYLEEVFVWITKLVTSYKPKHVSQLLYGGSVTEKNIAQLKTISNIDGFLVGEASTHFEQFSAIIKLS